MNCKLISFVSAKGGSGKTVISASLSALLAGLSKKVLMIDLDIATNGLTLLYLNELVDSKSQFGNKQVEPIGIFEATETTSSIPFHINNGVDIIPSMYYLKQIEDTDAPKLSRTIFNILNIYRPKYDFIIIDAQAGSDSYSKVAIDIADEVVIVGEYDPISVAGIERLKNLFPNSLSFDKTWILFNKVLPEFSNSLSNYLSVARHLPPVPWNIEVVRAMIQRKLAIDMKKGNPYTLAIMRTASSLFGKQIENEINNWRQDKETTLKQPINTQLSKIEKEIESFDKARIQKIYELKSLEKRSRNFLTMLLSFLVGMFGISVVLLNLYINILDAFIYSLSVVGSLGIISYIYSMIIERRSIGKSILIQGELNSLESQISELKIKRQTLKAIAEFKVEDFINTL